MKVDPGTKTSFVTYAMIVGATILVCANPLTYGLLATTDNWWELRLNKAYFLLIDLYIVAFIAAGILWRARRRAIVHRLLALMVMLFLPYVLLCELVITY